MKNLKNLNGAKTLSKKEQKSISGGRIHCNNQSDCGSSNYCCVNHACYTFGSQKCTLIINPW